MDLKKQSFALSIVNGIRFILAFIFQIFLARQFGVSSDLDCLFVALTVFTFAGMTHLFLTSLFIPLFNELREESIPEGFLFADVALKWVFGLSLAVAAVLYAAGDGVVALFASGFGVDRTALTVQLVRLFLFSLVFHGASMTIGYIFNALYRFSLPAVTALLHPVANILFLFYFVPRFGVLAIGYAALFSNVVQFVILILALAFLTPWRPTHRWYHSALPNLLNKSTSLAISGVLWDLREVITRQLSSHLPVGSVAIIAYAEKFVFLLHNISVSPVAKVFFSKASSLIVARAWTDVKALYDRIFKGTTILLSWIAANVVVFFVPLMSLFFLDSRFSSNDIYRLYGLMLILLVQTLFQSYGDYDLRILFSEQRVGAVLKIRLAGICAFLLSTPILAWWQRIFGVAIGYSLAQTLVYFICRRATQSVLRFRVTDQAELLLKCAFAALVMTIAGGFAVNWISSTALIVFVVIPIWNLFYYGLAGIIMGKDVKRVWSGLETQ